MVGIDLLQVEKLAMYDFSLEEMAVVLNVHHSTLYRRLANPETQKDFQDALDRGRAKLKSRLKSKMIENALTHNNVTLQIFLAKNHLLTADGKQYGDRQSVEVSGKVENVHTINMSADEARRQLALLMQDEEVKQFMLQESNNDVTDGSLHRLSTQETRANAAAVITINADSSDAGGNHTTGEASTDNSSAPGTGRGDRSSARTRRKKGARRRNGARSRTKTSAKQRAERKDS